VGFLKHAIKGRGRHLSAMAHLKTCGEGNRKLFGSLYNNSDRKSRNDTNYVAIVKVERYVP